MASSTPSPILTSAIDFTQSEEARSLPIQLELPNNPEDLSWQHDVLASIQYLDEAASSKEVLPLLSDSIASSSLPEVASAKELVPAHENMVISSTFRGAPPAKDISSTPLDSIPSTPNAHKAALPEEKNSAQRYATRLLSMVGAASPQKVATGRFHKPRAFQRFRRGLRGFGSAMYSVFLVFRILFVYIIPGGIFIAIAFALAIVPNHAILAGDGAVALLIGNSILRAAHLEHYTDPGSAAIIGATGVVLAILCVGVLTCWLPPDEQGKFPWYITIPTFIVLMTLSGTIGSSLLLRHHVDIGDIDVLHATRAGALGGVILGPLMVFIGPTIVDVLGILLAPLWVAMSMGFRWVKVRSSETWSDNTYRSSYCYTYGSCGDDPDIDEEIAELETRHFQTPYQSRYTAQDSIRF